MTVGPNTPNLEDLLRLGISTAKAGNKDSAKVMFKQVIAQDKRNERAWLWLAVVEEDEIERRRILQTVLQLNPNNTKAKELLDALDSRDSSSERASIMLGLRILFVLVALLVIVGVVVFILTRG